MITGMESFQLCAQRHIGKKFEILFKSHLMITLFFVHEYILVDKKKIGNTLSYR